jgi:hypothetical protein
MLRRSTEHGITHNSFTAKYLCSVVVNVLTKAFGFYHFLIKCLRDESQILKYHMTNCTKTSGKYLAKAPALKLHLNCWVNMYTIFNTGNNKISLRLKLIRC